VSPGESQARATAEERAEAAWMRTTRGAVCSSWAREERCPPAANWTEFSLHEKLVPLWETDLLIWHDRQDLEGRPKERTVQRCGVTEKRNDRAMFNGPLAWMLQSAYKAEKQLATV
jgi:hypothetical protein